MEARVRRRRRPWLRVLGLASAVAALPLPVLAAEDRSPASPQALPHVSVLARQAVAAVPASALCASDAPVQAQATTQSEAAAETVTQGPTQAQAATQAPAKSGGEKPSRWSFFKTPAGVAVLATVAAGLGYTLYSMQHDRVSSPGKQ